MQGYSDELYHFGFGFMKGKERENHRYYARVATGTDKKGHAKYRYFYSRDEWAAYQRSGKKRLTGEYGSEKHPNGRTASYAMEQYTDKDGKLQTRKVYVTRDVADKLRDAEYKRQKALSETDKEKKARMKSAKKHYKKKTSSARRKRAAQKGAQTVARLLGKQLTFQQTGDKNAEKKRKKAGWKNGIIPGTYTRKLKKKVKR